MRLGFVGSTNPIKGLKVLLRELQLIKDRMNVEVHIFGLTYDENLFKEFPRLLDYYHDRIIFHGRFGRDVESLKSVYENIDVLVFASICEENAPLVVREALMTGTPVLASNLGGVPEIVVDGKNGLLFDPRVEGDLSRKIENLITNKELRLCLLKGAKETVVLDIDGHAAQIANLYVKLIERYSGKKQLEL